MELSSKGMEVRDHSPLLMGIVRPPFIQPYLGFLGSRDGLSVTFPPPVG